MKIGVIGGGSTYTPELVEGLLDRRGDLGLSELCLHDIDAERLDIVAAFAERIADERGIRGLVTRSTSREETLDGALFAVAQLRVGGQEARLVDETLPLRFGCIGQETTGPGGFAKALRTVPVVLEIAEELSVRGDQGAWLVDFTNPVGIVTQALLDEGHRAVGVCNVAIGLQRELAERLGVDASRVELEHVGLNHLTWERAVRVDGVDRLPDLLEEAADELGAELHLPGALLRSLGVIPSPYLRYYYMRSAVLDEQAAGPPRAATVARIERELLALYQDPAVRQKPELLEQRGGAFYSLAAARLLASLSTGQGDIQALDVRNDGAIPDLPADAVVEVPCQVHSDGPRPVPLAPLAPELAGLTQQVKAYERLAVEAAVTGSRRTALRALIANPFVPSFTVAEPLLDALLAANEPHLPRFARAR